MRRFTGVVAVLVVASAGCTALRGGVRENYIHSRVAEFTYSQPLEEIFTRASELLTDEKLEHKRSPGDFYIETEWQQSLQDSQVVAHWTRYVVKVEDLQQGRSAIRVLRQTKTAAGVASARGGSLAAGAHHQANSLMSGGKVSQYQRDLQMEWKLLSRVDPKAADEILRLAAMQVDGQRPAPAALAAAPEQAPSAVAATGPECGAPIGGLDPLLQPGTVLLLGEVHGTREIPQFVFASVCWAVRKGIPVAIGIEHPVEEEENLADFLAGTRSRDELLAADVWNRSYQDGRTSEAMLELLQSARDLRAQDHAVTAFAFDRPSLRGDPRELAMSNRIAARARASPEALVVVLTGNVHPRLVTGTEWDPLYRPMGERLRAEGLNVVSLDAAYAPGTGWLCTYSKKVECGERPMKGAYQGAAPFIYRFPEEQRGGYHGFYYVGPVSASPPAVSSEG